MPRVRSAPPPGGHHVRTVSVRTGVTDYIGAPQPEKWNRNTPLLPAPYDVQLDLGVTTLAEVLKSAGYATLHAGKWHLGGEGHWPEDQGFDVNKGAIPPEARTARKVFLPLWQSTPGRRTSRRTPPGTAGSRVFSIHREPPRSALFRQLLDYDVHTPLMARKDLQEKYEAKRARLGLEPRYGREGLRDVRLVQDHAVYAGMIEAMDSAVGQILKTLEELQLADHTIVIFTSDNGGLSTSEGWPTSNLPLRGGKGWLYEGGIRVPLIMRWPGVTRPGTLVDTPAIGMDLFATLTAASGKSAKSDGIDLAPVLRGEPTEVRPLFWHYPHYGNQGELPARRSASGTRN